MHGAEKRYLIHKSHFMIRIVQTTVCEDDNHIYKKSIWLLDCVLHLAAQMKQQLLYFCHKQYAISAHNEWTMQVLFYSF